MHTSHVAHMGRQSCIILPLLICLPSGLKLCSIAIDLIAYVLVEPDAIAVEIVFKAGPLLPKGFFFIFLRRFTLITDYACYMTAEKMNTDSMTRFLSQVSAAHSEEFIVMVLDGASSHKSKELKIPDNLSLISLPPYSPELNPAEQIWNILRRDYFANRVFDSLDSATNQAEYGLAEMAADKSAVRKLTNWPWISAIMKT